MEAGDFHVTDPLDTVHREMDGMVCSRHVYDSVQSPVIDVISWFLQSS